MPRKVRAGRGISTRSWKASSDSEGLGLAEVRVTVLKTVFNLDMTSPHCLSLQSPSLGKPSPTAPQMLTVLPCRRNADVSGRQHSRRQAAS